MSEETKDSQLNTSHTLLDRVRNPDDKEAWTKFVSYYEQYIYNILRIIKIAPEDADEVCQNVIIKLWKKMPEFVYNRDRGKFRSWLAVMIRNESNRYYRDNKNKLNIVDSGDEDIEKEDPNSLYDIETIIAEEWNEYMSTLAWESLKARFNENMQEVFLLHVDGKSIKEIADACDIKENTVYIYIQRIKTHLIGEIDKFDSELL